MSAAPRLILHAVGVSVRHRDRVHTGCVVRSINAPCDPPAFMPPLLRPPRPRFGGGRGASHSSRGLGLASTTVGPDGGFARAVGAFFMVSCNTQSTLGYTACCHMSKAFNPPPPAGDGARNGRQILPARANAPPSSATSEKARKQRWPKIACRQDKTLSVDSSHELVLTFLDRVSAGPLSASGFGAGVAARCARHPLPDVRL